MNTLSFVNILLIALGLSADCFAVALGISVSCRTLTRRQTFCLACSFGIFQTGMFFLGWLAGSTIVNLVAGFDHWLALGLLVFVGGRMIHESLHEERDEKTRDITRWLPVIILSVATSIDALAVGLSFAFLVVNRAVAGITIGLVAFAITIIGLIIGQRVGNLAGKHAELVGGIILIIIGIKIVLEHTL